MKNKSTSQSSAITLLLGTAAGFSCIQAHAISIGDVLTINPGVTSCINGDCYNYGTDVTTGSWLGLNTSNNGHLLPSEKIAVTGHGGGIILGTSQPASGGHAGDPYGAGAGYTNGTITESPGIDEPWGFFGNTGMDYTTTPITVLSSGTGTAVLDFSGWSWAYDGASIAMGSNFYSSIWGVGFKPGQAKITCSSAACAQGDSYALTYYATVPFSAPDNLGGMFYALHLEGTISAVPLPAAAWIFSSGLLGLLGVAGRRKAH